MYRIYYVRRSGGYAIYPLWESLAEAKPRLNFPKEDKLYNLRVDVVDPASTTDITWQVKLVHSWIVLLDSYNSLILSTSWFDYVIAEDNRFILRGIHQRIAHTLW